MSTQGLPRRSKASIIINMDGEKATDGIKKCRKFTTLVDFDKTIAVVSAALSRGCIPVSGRQHKDWHNLYHFCPHRRAMIRPYFVALATAAILALSPAGAQADRSNGSGSREPPLERGTQRSQQWPGQTGVASYYGKAHHGKRTASGARFNQNAMTAAHPWLPFGTKLRVTHVASGRSVIVVVNDRLPSKTRVLDLSLGAARQLGMIRQGIAKVEITLA
jgi:rare lipoprotein A